MTPLRIGILGDFNPKYHTHAAINAALEHSAAAIGETIQPDWLATPRLADPTAAARLLSTYHALWAAPVSPYDSADGMLHGIAYARSRGIPFTGT